MNYSIFLPPEAGSALIFRNGIRQAAPGAIITVKSKFMKISFVLLLCLFALQISAQEASIPSFGPRKAGIPLFEDLEAMADGACSLGCGIGWTLSATSTLESQSGNTYDVSKLEDGKRSTAWVEGVKGNGIGQRIMITFDEPYGDEKDLKIPFHGMIITNGYSKNADIWTKNGRVKKLLVWLNSKKMCYLELDDDLYPQQFFWTSNLVMVGPSDVVSLEIVEVYPGSKYEDTAISDLGFHGAH